MSNVMFTSDLHLGDKKVSAIRGFDSTEEHDQHIIDVWKSSVHKTSIVYVLGDLTSGRTRETEQAGLDIIASLPGRKRLISGNHDSVSPISRASHDGDWMMKWLNVFESVQHLGYRKSGGTKLMLSHFPYDGPEGDHTEENRYREFRPYDCGQWLLHGHTHREQQIVHERQVHVGFDAWGRLVDEREILELIASYT